MSPANPKGNSYERAYVAYLIERGVRANRHARGNKTGDVETVPALVTELKNAKRHELSVWMDQTQREKELAGADYGVLVVKRKGKGDIGKHFMILTVEDGLRLLAQAGVIEMTGATS